MWIVVEIGCIECGVPSNVVGVFPDKNAADSAARALTRSGPYRGGENRYDVFQLPPAGSVNPEYREASALV